MAFVIVLLIPREKVGGCYTVGFSMRLAAQAPVPSRDSIENLLRFGYRKVDTTAGIALCWRSHAANAP